MTHPSLVTLGETMGALTATVPGPLANGMLMRLGPAGAESTVAIGVRRLGHATAWVGRVGMDPIGTMILSCLRAEGVDVAHTHRDPAAATGLMLRERRTSDRTRAHYYRTAMAGSRLSPADVDPDLVASARVLHITGITPALSNSAAAAVRYAVDIAQQSGVRISLDINYRAALWSPKEAAAGLSDLVARTDILFAGLDEAALFTDSAEPAEIARTLSALGPTEVVLKFGDEGASAFDATGGHHFPAVPVTSVDPVGAGDGFVAGYLSALLDGVPLAERLDRATICGAFGVSVPGDWDGLPTTDELSLLAGTDIRR